MATSEPPPGSRVAAIFRTWLGRLPVLLAAVGMCGCQTAGYYRQAVAGQYQLLIHQQPLEKLIADPATPPALREKFQLVLKLRAFADSELHLPVNGHYRRYVDLHRRYVVWNIHAAPEFSLKPKSWWYPVVGRLTYRGYFSERLARAYAAKLARTGLDVHVGGVEAYSTLGWFRDPVLSSFIHHDETELAGILFHELAHQKLFVASDTDFNEAFATAVEQAAVRRWLRAKADTAAGEAYLRALRRDGEFVNLLLEARAELKALYVAGPQTSEVEKRRQKEQVGERFRQRHAQLRAAWNGFSGYDHWFDHPINNAQLNTADTYYTLLPAFARLLQDCGGDLGKFYAAARELGRQSKSERHRQLVTLAARADTSAGD